MAQYKRILITGAAGGLGEAMALMLAVLVAEFEIRFTPSKVALLAMVGAMVTRRPAEVVA